MGWFEGRGKLSREELKSFVRDYKLFGRHKFKNKIMPDFGSDFSSERILSLINESLEIEGNVADRLALTIIDLVDHGKHSGDCSIYSSFVNGNPEDGICNCGYGLQRRREEGDISEIYSQDLKERLQLNVNFQI